MFCKISGLGTFFDGLIVEVEKCHWTAYWSVKRIIDAGRLVGDRTVSCELHDLDKGGEPLLIHESFLFECDDPTKREFAHDNPFGKFLSEASYSKGNIKLAIANYEKFTTCTLIDTSGGKSRTLHTFWVSSHVISKLRDIVNEYFVDTDFGLDEDDLVFDLRQISLNTQASFD